MLTSFLFGVARPKGVSANGRTAAAKILGWDTVWAVLSIQDPGLIYAEINRHQRVQNGNQNLRTWLIEPTTVTPYLQAAFSNMTKMVGRPMVKRLAKAKGSFITYKQALKVAKHCQQSGNRAFIKQVLAWIIKHNMTFQVREILRAIRKNNDVVLATKLFWAVSNDQRYCYC